MRASFVVGAASLAAFSSFGCGGSSGSASNTATADAAALQATSTCSADTRAMTFVAGLAQSGTAGVFSAKLKDATPAPPARNLNVWDVEIDDASGAPVPGATIAVKPWMPDHGHGASIVTIVADEGAGLYNLSNMDLFMPGLWQVTLTVTSNGATDSIVYGFCIEE